MDDTTRRAVAYIAGIAISGKRSSAVYDYTNSRHFIFSGSFSSSQVSAYDYDARCHVGGSKSSGSLALYHYGNRRHINLNIDRVSIIRNENITGKLRASAFCFGMATKVSESGLQCKMERGYCATMASSALVRRACLNSPFPLRCPIRTIPRFPGRFR